MRTGQWLVVGIVGTSLAMAGVGWAFKRAHDGKRRARTADEAPSASAPAPRTYQRSLADGGPAAAGDGGADLPAPAAASVAAGVPREWAERNRAAIAQLEAGDWTAAIEGFEACHAALPDQPVFRSNLAEALVRSAVAGRERDARCAPCVEGLKRAVELAPERPELARLLERWTREAEAEAGFWRESSLHFELSYDGERVDLLWGSTRLLDALEAAYTDLGELFAFYPVERGRPKFRVVLYAREGFSLLTGLGDWAGGAFDGSAIRIPIADLAAEEWRLERAFRHELCHAFVREIGGTRVPGWLNEGLCQFVEHRDAARRDAAASQAQAALKGEEPIPLSQLAGSLSGWKDEAAITRAYRQSLAFTAYLWSQHGQNAVLAMIVGCAQGRSCEESFQAEARLDLASAFEAWLAARG